MLNVAYIHMPTKITEKLPLTKSWDEFFNSDNTLAESSLIGQLNTCDYNHETLIMTRIWKVITDKQITEPRKGFFFFFCGGWGGCIMGEGLIAYCKASKSKTSLHYISVQASSFANLHGNKKI